MDFSNLASSRRLDITEKLIIEALADVYLFALRLNIAPETLTVDWQPDPSNTFDENLLSDLLRGLSRLGALEARKSALE